MSIIFLLIPLSVFLAMIFLAAFIWAVRSGQYEDTCTPAMRLLLHDELEKPAPRPLPELGKGGHPSSPPGARRPEEPPVIAPSNTSYP